MKLLQSYSKKQFYRNEVAICLYSVIIYMGPPYVRIHVHGYPLCMLLIFKYQILEHSQMVMDDSKEVVFQQLLLDLQGPNREISYQAKRELEDIADNRSLEPLIEWYTNSANEMYLEPK